MCECVVAIGGRVWHLRARLASRLAGFGVRAFRRTSLRLIVVGSLFCLFVFLSVCSACRLALAYEPPPEIVLAMDCSLAASPSHPSAVLPGAPVPAGERVPVLGRDRNGVWLLVTYENIIGWIPAFYVDPTTGIAAQKLAVMPELAPQACAVYLHSTLSVGDTWLSSVDGSAIVQGMVYDPDPRARAQNAAVSVEIQGAGQVSESIVESVAVEGQGELVMFNFTLDDLQQGSRVAVLLDGFREARSHFMSAYYRNDCTTATPTPTATPKRWVSIIITSEPTPTPTRSRTPTPTRIPTRTPTRLPTPTATRWDVAFIRLAVMSPQGKPWNDQAVQAQAVVEWQDFNGAWHRVDNWVKPARAQVTWEVWRRDYDTGPFRWVVYHRGKPIGASRSFYLPHTDGEIVDVVVTLSEPP